MIFQHPLTSIHPLRGFARVLAFTALCSAGTFDLTSPLTAQSVDYDIVYVRWPRSGDDVLVRLPQGEDPYTVEPGADLVLLHPDGSQEILVDCEQCCVQDPAISFDGEWVYYTKMDDAGNLRSPSLLYKMQIGGDAPAFEEVQLTFDDGFEDARHRGNQNVPPALREEFSIRDMGPAPLPNGKIAFTSNRHATIAYRQGSAFSLSTASKATVMQLYVMDDHDGRLTSARVANLRQVGFGTLHMAQHPVLLTDGRLLFSNWDDAGGKFKYGMTTLYSIRPDGSGLRQVSEPHDHHKVVDHFATQLSGGDVVVSQYYPGKDFGYGILSRFAPTVEGPEYQIKPSPQKSTHDGAPISFRSFERRDWEVLTPHTWARDCPAPNLSGKYSMPGAAPGGDLLVAYSLGGVNYFDACDGHYYLHSGIYLIPNAAETLVTNPNDASQLVTILNSPDHNEIWPKAVVPYRAIYDVDEPASLPWTDSVHTVDDRLEPSEPCAIVGTSSLYNRESAPLHGDPFYNAATRENHSGSWMIQGADAGVVEDADIFAVRIIAVVPKPFRAPINKYARDRSIHANVKHLLHDKRYDTFVEGYTSVHGERWKILAEIPVRKRDSAGDPILDPIGDPDTSFAARIPANTPFFYQGIDADGLTLFSELTWRSAVPGEVRTDCGGCHAHTKEAVEFASTAAGRGETIVPPGLREDDPMTADGLWDVVNETPLLTRNEGGEPIVQVVPKGAVGVEYHHDVEPILRRVCASCHKTSGNTTGTDLAFDGVGPNDDAYHRLVQDGEARFGGAPPAGKKLYSYPQLSRYVRANQARQSLLAWKLFGRRLDGRTNAERDDDLDFTPHELPHGATDEEVRTIARWIDLGCPRDFTADAHAHFRYTDDNLLPVLEVGTPTRGENLNFDGVVRVGIVDVESGPDWNGIQIRLDVDLNDEQPGELATFRTVDRPDGSNVLWLTLDDALPFDRELLLETTVRDLAGNISRDTRRFWLASTAGKTPEGIVRPERAAPIMRKRLGPESKTPPPDSIGDGGGASKAAPTVADSSDLKEEISRPVGGCTASEHSSDLGLALAALLPFLLRRRRGRAVQA